jgi:1-aminocyclopropane-1-carboxylate deaminase
MELPLSPIRTISLKNLYQPQAVDVDVLRLDELHPQISGNKWFKLRLYIDRAVRENKKALLSFGGAWSNHLLATAAAGQSMGLQTIGIVRGETATSEMLAEAAQLGMRIFFSSRSDYSKKIVPENVWDSFSETETLIIPEGGFGEEGARGAAGIAAVAAWESYTHIVAAVGTGATLAGLATASLPGQMVSGISVLKNNLQLDDAVRSLVPHNKQQAVRVLHQFHEGGYARANPGLLHFMNEWFEKTGIPSDFVYTGKMFRAADTLIKQGFLGSGSRILLVHTGGLQGNRSLAPGTLIF